MQTGHESERANGSTRKFSTIPPRSDSRSSRRGSVLRATMEIDGYEPLPTPVPGHGDGMSQNDARKMFHQQNGDANAPDDIGRSTDALAGLAAQLRSRPEDR